MAICPEQDGLYEDPFYCDGYWECKHGVATEQFCTDGLVFDFRTPDSPCGTPHTVSEIRNIIDSWKRRILYFRMVKENRRLKANIFGIFLSVSVGINKIVCVFLSKCMERFMLLNNSVEFNISVWLEFNIFR